jgi:6-phosphogluconolactonase
MARNQHENAVAAFRRDINGLLTPVGRFPTGGAGNPFPQPGDPPVDPLASQGALIMSDGKRFLIAVNAGSNQISVLRINKNTLELADIVDSGGSRPISAALHDDLLYVLNEGGTPNIAGFTFNECDGTLKSLPNSTRPLVGAANADPAQIAFTPDGGSLVVTEKDGNRIDTYNINENGRAGPPRGNPSSGTTPFGFAFNNDGTLIVSEAFALMPNQAAVSSYNLGSNGTLGVISGSVHNNQTARAGLLFPTIATLLFQRTPPAARSPATVLRTMGRLRYSIQLPPTWELTPPQETWLWPVLAGSSMCKPPVAKRSLPFV